MGHVFECEFHGFSQPTSEDGIKEGLHIFAQSLTNRASEHTDASEHGTFVDGRSILGFGAQRLADVEDDAVQILGNGTTDGLCNLTNGDESLVAFFLALELGLEVDHEFVEIIGDELERGIFCEDGNDLDDLGSDPWIAVVLESEDNLAGVAVEVVHEHVALLKQFHQDEK